MQNKYHAKKCSCSHGCKHDSRIEAKRCEVLHQLEQVGKIACLVVHPKYVLLEPLRLPWRNEKAVNYTADFAYTLPTGDRVVEDVKSDATSREREYVLKRKLFEARFCQNGDVIFFENVGGNGRCAGCDNIGNKEE